ncbi:MAG: hypothetical protein IKQ54_05240 [Oscillospiraceae bacterium]|nr:hypothetical protein [Oscillospiraceae bacterium]
MATNSTLKRKMPPLRKIDEIANKHRKAKKEPKPEDFSFFSCERARKSTPNHRKTAQKTFSLLYSTL